MKKLVIFSAGIVTGVIATPVSIMYVKPVRRVFAIGLSKFLTYVVTEEAKKESSEFLAIIDEAYIAHRNHVAETKKAGNANI